MNKIYMIFFMLFWAGANAQLATQTFSRFASNEHIICNIYEGVWDTSRKACAWVPNFEAWYNLSGWYNKNLESWKEDTLFTSVAGVFFYQTPKYKRLVIATNTVGRSGGGRTCGAHWGLIELSLPLNKKEGNNLLWLDNFQTFIGYYGEFCLPGKLEFMYLGKGEYIVLEETDSSPQGIETTHWEIYYKKQELYGFCNFLDTNGNLSYPETEHKWNTKVNIDTTQQKIFLHTEGTEYDYKQRKMLTIDKKITIGFGKEGTFRVLGD